MPRYTLSCLIAVALLFLAGCMGMPRTPLAPPPGFIFEEVQAPLSLEYDQTAAAPGKVGEATVRYLNIPIIWLSFAWDEASVETAAQNGGIQEVSYADYQLMQILGVYSEFTVRAYGR